MKYTLNDFEERNAAALDEIRKKYADEARHRRTSIILAETRIEVRKEHLKLLEEQRAQYAGIISVEARQEWNRLSSAMAKARQRIDEAKQELSNIYTKQY